MKRIVLCLFFLLSTSVEAGYLENRIDEWSWIHSFEVLAFDSLVWVDMRQTRNFCGANRNWLNSGRKVLMNSYDVERYGDKPVYYMLREGSQPYSKETNPLLGPYPSDKRIKVVCISTMIIYPVVSFLLPNKYKQFWFGSTIGMEAHAVYMNHKGGISANINIKF
jgi:hypothetical protein